MLNGKRNYAEFAKVLNISETTVKRRLNDLKKDGFIRRIGSNKTGYWECCTQ